MARVLTSRLGTCIDELVDDHQFAFIKGRQLLDCSLIANEAIHSAKSSGKKAAVFKIDFRKAYDSVDWDFLDFVGLIGFVG